MSQGRDHADLEIDERDDVPEVLAEFGQVEGILSFAPVDPRVLRTLSQAIRALVERESLVEAAQHLMEYVNLGAPLGMELRREAGA